jgi:hypothetical protein
MSDFQILLRSENWLPGRSDVWPADLCLKSDLHVCLKCDQQLCLKSKLQVLYGPTVYLKYDCRFAGVSSLTCTYAWSLTCRYVENMMSCFSYIWSLNNRVLCNVFCVFKVLPSYMSEAWRRGLYEIWPAGISEVWIEGMRKPDLQVRLSGLNLCLKFDLYA